MGNLRNKIAGAALAGVLLTGGMAAPATAGDDHRPRHDGKVHVLIVKETKKDKKTYILHKDLKLEDAAKRAAKRCDEKEWRMLSKAKDAEYGNKSVKACKDKKGGKDIYVYFKDNDDKKHDKKH